MQSAKVFRDAGGSDLIMRTISLGCGCRPLSILRGWGRHLLSSSARPNQCRLQDSFLKPSSSPRPSQISSPSSQHPVRSAFAPLSPRPFAASSVFLASPTFFLKPNRKKYSFERIQKRRPPAEVWFGNMQIGDPTSQTWPIILGGARFVLSALLLFHLKCDPTALKTDRSRTEPRGQCSHNDFANIQVGGSNFELCPGALPKFTTKQTKGSSQTLN